MSLFYVYQKQEVLIILDDPRPTEILSGDGRSQTSVTPQINQSQCLLDLSIQPEPVPDGDSQSKPALESLSLSDSEVSKLFHVNYFVIVLLLVISHVSNYLNNAS